MKQLKIRRPIVFFDLESTGLSTTKDRIVEMAFVKLLPDGSRATFVRRINPGMPIPEEATAIHGLTDNDVRGAPPFRQVAKELHAWMQGCDMGGYNSARFDLPLLVEEFLRAGVAVDFSGCKMIDVQQIFFKMEQRTLTAAYRYYCGKPMEAAHNAESDINATIEVLHAQLAHYEDLGCEVADLHCINDKEDEAYLDYGRAIMLRKGVSVFNFGKHKGKPVEDIFTKDPAYYDWMMKGDFSLHTKQKITEILTRMKLGQLLRK